MELRHLRYFVAVAETGSFTRAAEQLHTAQPSLSRQIQDLEAEVGVRLLQRNSRHLRMTAAGIIFFEEAKRTLEQADRAVERARQAARAEVQSISVGFLLGVEVELLVRVMTALQGELESVHLGIRSQSSPELITALHREELDVAFVRPGDESRGLTVVSLRKERLFVALSAKHRFAKADRIAVEDLSNERFITVANKQAPVLDDIIRSYAAKHGVSLSDAYEVENLTMAFSLISSVGGVGLLPEYAIQLLPKSVVAIPLPDEAPTIDLALAYNPSNKSAQLRTFLTHFLPEAS